MELKIKSMSLRNFKGVTDKKIAFNGNTKIKGRNGAGKSSIADAFYFTFCDCNTALVKNPPITPISKSECESVVEIELELDGKPLSIAKKQKFKQKESDGKVTSAITNSYEINGVNKAYKDFVADLTERGIDMENFLIFSHPAAFTNDTSKAGREKMRALLFQMCEGVTDADIIAEMSDVNDLVGLLGTYKLDEIESMNRATIKRIIDTMGKDNAIVNARIDELISQKSTLDIKVLESQKAEYEAEIERIENELAHINDGKADTLKNLSKLKLQREEIESKVAKETFKARTDLEESMQVIKKEINDKTYEQHKAIDDIGRVEADIAETESNLEKQRALYQDARDMVLEDDATRCPTCGREFEADKLSQIRADFDKNKADRIKTLKATGKTLKDKLEALNNALADLKKNEKKIGGSLDDSRSKYNELEAELNKLPDKSSVLAKNDAFAKINDEIAKIEDALRQDEDSRIGELKSQLNVNKAMLHQIVADMGAVNHNKEIDARIETLRTERKDAEINKANAEKVLDEVERFKRFKNDKLSTEINKHFEIAQFRLFKTLKNGSTEEALDVLIDGKEINTQANQSLQVLAKLDIIKGLSDYFEIWMPVFADDFSLFTAESEAKINMKNQLIKLVATDGVKELQIEEG